MIFVQFCFTMDGHCFTKIFIASSLLWLYRLVYLSRKASVDLCRYGNGMVIVITLDL